MLAATASTLPISATSEAASLLSNLRLAGALKPALHETDGCVEGGDLVQQRPGL